MSNMASHARAGSVGLNGIGNICAGRTVARPMYGGQIRKGEEADEGVNSV